MKMTPIQLYLKCLRVGKVRSGYVSREVAYENLKLLTGQDFGLDVEKWKEWHRINGKRVSYLDSDGSAP